MKTLYLECNMGAAGDMLMAALYELMTESEKHDFLETIANPSSTVYLLADELTKGK